MTKKPKAAKVVKAADDDPDETAGRVIYRAQAQMRAAFDMRRIRRVTLA